ncbi:hypothetical protein K4K59_008689 [Colletotrichum sp. SAR11_240]|nr:hypothetical protein K4K59_008689 [Colletotrichum sp. SAR11_240]
MENTFQVDLDILQDPTVPADQKRWMLDIVITQIVPYRYHQEPRLFPDLNFYGTLLNNRADFMQIWGFVTRFHGWIYDLAISSPAMADEAIESLNQMQANLEIDDLLTTMASAGPSPFQYPSPPRTTADASVPATPQEAPKQSGRATRATPADADDSFLATELKKPPTFVYGGIIRDLDHFAEVDEAYNCHVKRSPGFAPEEDQSWPSNSEKRVEYVQQMYEAITSTDDFFELRKATERLQKITAKGAGTDTQLPTHNGQTSEEEQSRKRKRPEERPKGLSKADWDLLNDANSGADRLSAVVHHKISDIEIEILCWRLMNAAMDAQRGHTKKPLWSGHRTTTTWDHYNAFEDRWAAMARELTDCKILLHSLMRADWFAKFASAPAKERGAKLSNDLLNGRRDIQNQIGRETIREKTTTNEWTTSENFEIRTRDGSLVHEGDKIGDRGRRALAKRQKV